MSTRHRGSGPAGRRLATAIGLSCAVAWLGCAPAADAGAEQTAPQATAAGVEAALQAFIDGWEAQDLETVLGTFTADAVAFDAVPPVKFTGTEGIRAWVSGAFDMFDTISIPLSEVEIDTHGQVGWSSARYTFEAEGGGETTGDEGYVSMVWVLQDDGSYRATLFHASNLPEEPAADDAS